MATLSRWDKTLPCLLDRISEGDASKDVFVSPLRYLESVRRDLYWLFRTEVSRTTEMLVDRVTGKSLADFENASISVLAYGVPKLSGEHGVNSLGVELARTVERAIRIFEPRIDPGTLRVRPAAKTEGEQQDGTVSVFGFEIEGDVRMKPVPEHLSLKAYYVPAITQWRMEGIPLGS
jgi:type VI secretion system protein ImpF